MTDKIESNVSVAKLHLKLLLQGILHIAGMWPIFKMMQ